MRRSNHCSTDKSTQSRSEEEYEEGMKEQGKKIEKISTFRYSLSLASFVGSSSTLLVKHGEAAALGSSNAAAATVHLVALLDFVCVPRLRQ